MDRGDWQVTVHGVAKSWTRAKRLGTELLPKKRHKKIERSQKGKSGDGSSFCQRILITFLAESFPTGFNAHSDLLQTHSPPTVFLRLESVVLLRAGSGFTWPISVLSSNIYRLDQQGHVP